MTRDEQYALDAGILETLEEHALADHAGGTENDDLHESRGYSVLSGSVR